ncbi:hypothetical protein Ddc_21020 [Ditylenchus destructor]|nr:hypothetical protein Ddc_21020 [Ditylenchus destructor]
MSEIIPGQSVKQLGSRKAVSGAEKRSRNTVEISNDTWLVALKFLTGWENWTSMRFVSFQINGVIESNASRLPLVVFEDATVLKNVHLNLRQQNLSCVSFTDVSGHIRCGKFMLEDNFRNINKFREYLSWTEHNVRADQIKFRSISHHKCDGEAQIQELDAISNFIFDSSHLCANEVQMYIESEHFLNTLVDKFRTISVIDSRIPTIVIIAYPGSEHFRAAFFLIFLDKQQAQASTVIDPKSLSSPFSEPA